MTRTPKQTPDESAPSVPDTDEEFQPPQTLDEEEEAFKNLALLLNKLAEKTKK
jgi:hypothetical protein